MPKFSKILVFLALILLCFPAISPFFQDGMLLSDDGFLHLYRAIAIDYSMKFDASIYPRFSSGLVYGYGAPLFNFYPVASYYPTVILHSVGLSWIVAWKASMAFFVFMAAWGSYLLGKLWTNRLGGFATAIAYVYAPYALFDTVARGTSTEFAAMAFLPFALWGFTLLAKRGLRRDFLFATFGFAIFTLMHAVITLFGTIFLVGYCGILFLSEHGKSRLLWQMALAGVLALCLSSFFWLPALAETNFVKINGVTENLSFIDVSNSMRSLGDVFALPRTSDPSQLQAQIPIVYGLPAILLAMVALIAAFLRRKNRLLFVYLVGFFALTVYLQVDSSLWFWNLVSILRYSQFAWRVLSIGTLALALLAGSGVAEIIRVIHGSSLRLFAYVAILLILMLYSFSWLYRPTVVFAADSILDSQAHERNTNSLALSSYSEYLPIWNETPPDPSRFENFPLDTVPTRLQANEAVQILQETWQGTSAEITLEASDSTTLVFNWLYFVGWRAELDGQIVEVFPSGEEGLVAVHVDAGTHTLKIYYGMTDVQRNSTILSVTSLLLIIAVAIFWRSQVIPMEENPSETNYIVLVIFLGLGLFLLKSFVLDSSNSPFKTERFVDGQIVDADYPQRVNFNQEIGFLGSSYQASRASGTALRMSLYWTAIAPVAADYSSSVSLRDEQGNLIAQTGAFYPADLATHNWREGYYLEEILDFEIPDYTVPKVYTLFLSLYDSESGRLLDIFNEAGNPIAVETRIGVVTIERPTQQLDYEETPIASVNGMSLLEFSGLIDFSLRDVVQAGNEIRFHWLWRKEDESALDGVTLRLEGAINSDIAFSALIQNFSIEAWQIGDIWRGYQTFYLPADLPAGAYSLSMVYGQWNFPLNQSIVVTVPVRNFDLPNPQFSLETTWQNGIQLVGYDMADDSIVLYWQTAALLDESLRLFVQVFDENGQVLAVSDSIPVDWTRPTTSWIAGEFIRTEHTFSDLQNGSQMLIGWYRPQTGERILLTTGEDALRVSP